MTRRTLASVPAVALVLALGACAAPRGHRLEGHTMGTTWRVTVASRAPVSAEELQESIVRRLEEVNRQLSTWRDDSEISRFNREAAADESFPVSDDFLQVMNAAAEVFRLSEGAWDGTVGPLVSLWGSGPEGPAPSRPSPDRLSAARETVGFDRIGILPEGALVRRAPGIVLDLSSIAKGHAVDAVASLLRAAGHADFLVEIGGEVFASGQRPAGGPWRVGINRPHPGAGLAEIYKVVPLADRGLATSGDYRSYVLEGGRRLSHVIDPRTGEPVENGVVSASVLAPTCMLADGLATAVMVMGPHTGLELVETLEGVEGLIVVERSGGLLEEHVSTGFETLDAPRP